MMMIQREILLQLNKLIGYTHNEYTLYLVLNCKSQLFEIYTILVILEYISRSVYFIIFRKERNNHVCTLVRSFPSRDFLPGGKY